MDLFMRAIENGMGLHGPEPHNYVPREDEVVFEQHLHFNPGRDTPAWVKKDGNVIEISDMKDSHIINARRMILRGLETGRLTKADAFWYRQWIVEFDTELDRRDVPLMVR